VDIHATDLVGINGITRVLLVYTCQRGVYTRGHVLPLRLPSMLSPNAFTADAWQASDRLAAFVAAVSHTGRSRTLLCICVHVYYYTECP
jgi:hypothetical protein